MCEHTVESIVMISVRRIAPLLCAVAALTAGRGAARAAEGEDDERGDPGPTSLSQEYVGFELTPASLLLTSTPVAGNGEAPPSRLQAGPGAAIRVGRHRWEFAYVIPFQAALYVSTVNSGGNDTIAARLEFEGGLIVPGTDRRLEIGLAPGVGILAIGYSVDCDGSCRRGGAGAMVSPVVRYLFRDGPSVTIGASLRALIPLSVPRSEVCFGYCTGFGSVLLGGVEVGIGRGILSPSS